jgi:hypothetical protein
MLVYDPFLAVRDVRVNKDARSDSAAFREASRGSKQRKLRSFRDSNARLHHPVDPALEQVRTAARVASSA